LIVKLQRFTGLLGGDTTGSRSQRACSVFSTTADAVAMAYLQQQEQQQHG
jgi:hypothetical protein